MFIVISYDIRNDKRRTRMFKTLKNFGQWMQYSVFECELSRMEYVRLKGSLDCLIEPRDDDSVRFYTLCEECKKRVERIGGIKPRAEGSVIV
jgi:CRISPR-associated protein Cas2